MHAAVAQRRFSGAMIDLLRAALADRYEIERELGTGGMATVFLATDLRHDRRVAIKVLRPDLAAVLGAERFLSEIRVTANLQHPHILPLHDSGEADGLLYYVMPYVDGESLRDRLDRETQLSVEGALRITYEVADGLSYAHGLGVIHRDIKPANILLTGGHAVVADFGIARAVTEAGGTRLTETGLSLGTPQYMSPEQAGGEKDVDGRSDQYSLACVLYEMLAGEAPHTGPSAQAIMARVLTQPPPSVRTTRDRVHPQTDDVLRRAMAPLAADRFPTVERFAEVLRLSVSGSWAEATGVGAPAAATTRGAGSLRLAWGLVVVLAVGVVLALTRPFAGSTAGPNGVIRLSVDLTPADSVAVGGAGTTSGAESDVLAISEDGRRIAFVGRTAGDPERAIYVRELDAFTARRLPGTESGMSPFFSPDGQWVGFYSWSDGRLKVVPIGGGAPQVVCTCDPILAADWGSDGTIVLDSEGLGPLRVVPTAGGVPEVVGPLEQAVQGAEYNLNHPRFLPDGRHVLVTAWGGGGGTRRIAAVSLDTGERVTLIEDGWGAQYVRGGYLVYQRQNELWAVPFDPDALEVRGTPVPVVDSVFSVTFTMIYAASATGTLVYGPGPIPDLWTEVHLIRPPGEDYRIPADGEARNTASSAQPEQQRRRPEQDRVGPDLSPDGTRVVFAGADAAALSGGRASSRIWVADVETGRTQALTDSGLGDFWPIWAPDGRSVVFGSIRSEGDGMALRQVPADGSGPPVELYSAEGARQPQSWLPGGEGLIFQQTVTMDSDYDIGLLPMTGDAQPTLLIAGPANEIHPSLSPDGRWLAYASDRSGRYEIYLRPYPDLDSERQISTGGGRAPRWSWDGRTLYYGERDQGSRTVRFLRVPMDGDPGTAEPVWETQEGSSIGSTYGKGWDLAPDGRLVVSLLGQPWPRYLPELRIVLNWTQELRDAFERD